MKYPSKITNKKKCSVIFKVGFLVGQGEPQGTIRWPSFERREDLRE